LVDGNCGHWSVRRPRLANVPARLATIASHYASKRIQASNLNSLTLAMEETAEKTAEKTSTWLALRNPVFRRLWSAMVISGSCIGAHNTAVYWAMHKLGASTLHIALMTTVSALPYTPVHLARGRRGRHGRSQKDFINSSNLACLHRVRTGNSVDGASA
jgi:hypothetical protein